MRCANVPSQVAQPVVLVRIWNLPLWRTLLFLVADFRHGYEVFFDTNHLAIGGDAHQTWAARLPLNPGLAFTAGLGDTAGFLEDAIAIVDLSRMLHLIRAGSLLIARTLGGDILTCWPSVVMVISGLLCQKPYSDAWRGMS